MLIFISKLCILIILVNGIRFSDIITSQFSYTHLLGLFKLIQTNKKTKNNTVNILFRDKTFIFITKLCIRVITK